MNHFEEEWHSDLPHSFGGKYRSYEYYKHNTHQKDIDDEFKRNDIYSRFKQYKRAKHHNPVYVYKKRELFTDFQKKSIFLRKKIKIMKYIYLVFKFR